MDFLQSFKFIKENRKQTIFETASFLDTDTILFWDVNDEIKKQQKLKWQPLLDLLANKYGVQVKKSDKLITIDNNSAKQKYIQILENMQNDELAICVLSAKIFKSVLLGLLFAKSDISVEEAFEAAFLEEIQQNKKWGVDEQVALKRRQIKEELNELKKFGK